MVRVDTGSNIRISSLIDAPKHIPWAEQVVSILDPDLPYRLRRGHNFSRTFPYVPDAKGKRHLVRRFLDTEFQGRWSPTCHDVEDIFSWVEPGKPTLVHCHAGMSRSVSIAMGLMLQQGSSYYEVDKTIQKYEQERMVLVEPNMLIISYIDNILQHGGAFVEWCKETYYKGYKL